MTDIFEELKWRGLIYQTTDESKLRQWLNENCRTLYIGFDPTADSLHVGSMMQLMTLRRFQRAGHRPIALVGGATGMIGDPSGKSEERNLLSVDSLRANVVGMEKQMRSFLDFDDPQTGALLVNNFDWMRRFSYLDFLRDIGKNIPVSMMMSKDSVKTRLARDDAGISYTEFSYMLLQAYDFVHLNEQYDCQLQVGGSDQWGNITAGIDLARRMRGVQLHGITCPLLTKTDGTKMGKTETGTVWLSAEKTSPYLFYQYWINIADEEAGTCLRYLTDLPQEEVRSLDESRADQPHLRASQKRLAEELTRTAHGEQALAAVQRTSEKLFAGEIHEMTEQEKIDAFADVPSKQLPAECFTGAGLLLIDALVETGLCKSKSDARRLIKDGGAYVEGRRIKDIEYAITDEDFAGGNSLVLRAGKKKYAVLKRIV